MLSLRRFFRPVLEWLEARLAPAVAVTPPVDATLPVSVALPTQVPSAPATVSLAGTVGNVAALDALFASGPLRFADFDQIPPPVPEKFTLGLLEGSAQRPAVLELPAITESVVPGAEDTALRDRVFLEAPLTVFEVHPDCVSVPDDCTPIVVAA